MILTNFVELLRILSNMLISIIIGFIIAFVLGKKTVKNIKENGRRKEKNYY